MATLKCMHAHNVNVTYHTDIRTISVVERWAVDTPYLTDPWGAFRSEPVPDTGKRSYATPNVVHVASMAPCHPDHDDGSGQTYALLVICERPGEPPFGVVCEASSTYLMGDDGGTIDRL